MPPASFPVCAYAWYAIYGERGMRRYDPWTVVFYAFLFASLFWNIALEPFGAFRVRYTGVQWFWVIYIVVFGTAVPYGLYTMGDKSYQVHQGECGGYSRTDCSGIHCMDFSGRTPGLAPNYRRGACHCLCYNSPVKARIRRDYFIVDKTKGRAVLSARDRGDLQPIG